jgi:hypothetical protein
MFRKLGLSLLLPTVLFSSSCGFFGSKYTSGGAATSNLQQAGPATQLLMTGAASVALGNCTGPYLVSPRDKNGNAAQPLPAGTMFSLIETSGSQLYLDDACSTAATGNLVPLLNDGSNSGKFYLSGKQEGNFFMTAQLDGMTPYSMPVQFIPGSAKGIKWSGSRAIAAFSCAEVTISIVDVTGTATTYATNLALQVDAVGMDGLDVFDGADCAHSISETTISAGTKTKKVYVFSSQPGDFNMSATPQVTGWAQGQMPMTALNSQAPKLLITPATATFTVDDCFNYSVRTVTSTGDAFNVKAATAISLDGPSDLSFYPGANCQGVANRSLSIPAGAGLAAFSTKSSALLDAVTASASAPYYVSGITKVTVGAGAPKSLVLKNAPSPVRAGACYGPVQLQLQDAFGHAALASAATEFDLSATDSQGTGTKFYTDAGCAGAAIKKISVAANQGNVGFYFFPPAPGATTISAAHAVLGKDTRPIVVQNAQGTPKTLKVDPATSAYPLLAGKCIAVLVQSVDGNGFPLDVAPADLKLNLSTDFATAKAYADDNCTQSINSITLASGTNLKVFYYVDTAAEKTLLTLTENAPVNSPVTGSQYITVTANVSAQLAFDSVVSPQMLLTCSPANFKVEDRYGNISPFGANTDVPLTSTNAAAYFSDSACSVGNEITKVTFAANDSQKLVYFRGTKVGELRLIALGPVGVSAGVSDLLTISPPPPTHLIVTPAAPSSGPTLSYLVGQCIPFYVGSVDPHNQPAIFENISVDLAKQGIAQNIFFADNGCNTPLSPATLQLGLNANPKQFWVGSKKAAPSVIITAVGSTGGTASTAFSFVPGPAAKLLLGDAGPASFLKGNWFGAYEVSVTDAYDNVIVQNANLPVTFAGNGLPQIEMAANADGSGNGVVILAGRATANFYLRSSAAGVLSLAVAAANLQSNTRVVTVMNPRAQVASITPNYGTVDGGTPVVLRGSDFLAGLTVMIGGAPCTSLEVVDSTMVRCVTSAHSEAPVDVVTLNRYAEPFTFYGGYNYFSAAPSVSEVSPPNGLISGGMTVHVLGSGFKPGAAVKFDQLICGSVIVLNEHDLTCTIPAHPVGIVSVSVQNTGSMVGKKDNAFSYLAPPAVVTGVSPNTGSIAEGKVITVSGSGFQPGATVRLGSLDCGNVIYISPTQIRCTTPRVSLPAAYPVIVTNPGGQPSTCQTILFTYLNIGPTIAGITPNRGPVSGGTPLVINGNGFLPNAQVLIGSSLCADVRVTPTQITCRTPGGAEATLPVWVTNPGSVPVMAGNFVYEALRVLAIAPPAGPVLGGTNLVISGTGFGPQDRMTIGGLPCATFNYVSPTELRCVTPKHAAGPVVFQVTDGVSNATAPGGFLYQGPWITGIIPAAGTELGNTLVTLIGTNFVSGMIVKFDQTPCTGLTVRADGAWAQCFTPPHAIGMVGLSVKLSDLPDSLSPATYRYFSRNQSLPSIGSITPNYGPTSGGTRVTIRGNNFVNGIRVLLGGSECTNLVIANSTQLSCTTPKQAAGYASVAVRSEFGIAVVPSINFNYQGSNPLPSACAVFTQMSAVCGDDNNYEWTAAFAPIPGGLSFASGMNYDAVKRALKSPYHDPSGTLDRCNRVPTTVRRQTMPRSYTYNGRTYAIYTDNNLGSEECPAFFSLYYSPLIVDMKNEGITLSAPNKGVQFDIEGDGVKRAISWPVNSDSAMFLVLDRNGNANIDSVHELFGNNTVGPDGQKAANGFEALRKYDSNRDGVIDRRDAIFASLRLWADHNHNGVVDEGELLKLDSQGLVSFDLTYESVNERNDFYGNETLERSVVDLRDGTLRRIFDIWFAPGAR